MAETNLTEMELREQLERAESRVYSLEGVIAAVDRVLAENSVIHASRAIAIELLVKRLRAESAVCPLCVLRAEAV
jgi:hypothetical protein